MSMKKTYAKLSADATRLEAARAAHEKDVKVTIENRLYSLQAVGLSILRKSFGRVGCYTISTVLAPKLHHRYFDFLVTSNGLSVTPFHWKTIELTGDVIVLYSKEGDKRIVPKEVLSLSDRDFAKLVRNHAKELKEKAREDERLRRERELDDSIAKEEKALREAESRLAKLLKMRDLK